MLLALVEVNSHLEVADVVNLGLLIVAIAEVQAGGVGLSFLHARLEYLVLPVILGVEAALSAARRDYGVVLYFWKLAGNTALVVLLNVPEGKADGQGQEGQQSDCLYESLHFMCEQQNYNLYQAFAPSNLNKQCHYLLNMMNSLNCRFIGEFEKGEIIGEGTYGIVFFARSKDSSQPLAIKKMKVLDNQDGFPITSLRQVKILQKLSGHPNIVALKEVVVGVKPENVFLVFQYCEIDLYKLMGQMSIDKASFAEAEIKCLSLQLIKGVQYAHSQYVVHRDLKLTNLLLSREGILKIADFGLARQYQKPQKPLTRKVVTLWYRAPELLLREKEYSQSVDIWSVGCIMAELLRQGSPLFQGNSQVQQFQLIAEVIGYPAREEWKEFFAEEKKEFRKSVEKSSLYRKNRIASYLPNVSASCIELLTQMLCWDPRRRIPLDQALLHPYFRETPKAIFPDQIKVLSRLQFYCKKSKEELNKKNK